MTPEAIGVLISLTAAFAPWRALPDPTDWRAPSFIPAERAVDNWRRESASNLDLTGEQALALALGRDIKGLSRCVRLNNYWCVKKAGWIGEIASDSEGHVAFSSAREGAAVAAALLRRYYVDFKLHTARAIVQRWAPARCGYVAAAPARKAAGRAAPRAAARRLLGPEPKGLTTHGLGNTLRARWLASHGRASGPRKVARASGLRRSVVPDRVSALMKTPSIVAGVGAIEPAGNPAGKPVKLAMLPFPGVGLGPTPTVTTPLPSLPPLPVLNCASETQRIANYAAHIAEGVAAGPDADLGLFDPDGAPTPAFGRALFNMAAVEIGPLRASRALVDEALAIVLARRAAGP